MKRIFYILTGVIPFIFIVLCVLRVIFFKDYLTVADMVDIEKALILFVLTILFGYIARKIIEED